MVYFLNFKNRCFKYKGVFLIVNIIKYTNLIKYKNCLGN